MLLLLTTTKRYASLLWQALKAPFDAERRLGGALLVLLAFPLFIAWQLLHWLGFLLDEILFRGYRDVEVREPVFIIGPPRTGTTHLHHVMSSDPESTTFRAWECLFALSITGRKLCLTIAAADRAIGRPFARLGNWLGAGLTGAMDDIHPLGLDDPEEDFLALMPPAACFLLVVPFPRAEWLWRTARLDVDVGEREQRMLMRHYRRCIQKHLYVFGRERRFLSKNASFAGMTETLLDTFPDARILATVRDPVAAVPSQLSSLRPGLSACGYREVPAALRNRLVDLLVFYFEHLAKVAALHRNRVAIIYNDELQHALQASVVRAMDAVDLPASATFLDRLAEASRASQEHQSSHRYTLEEFDLSEDLIRSRFERSYAQYEFDVDRRKAATSRDE